MTVTVDPPSAAEQADGTSSLIHALQRLHVSRDRHHAAIAQHHKLSASELNCLRLLDTDGPQPPTQVAAHLGVTPSAVTAMINTLVRRNLAVRTNHPNDRRIVLVSATPEGISVARALTEHFAHCLSRTGADIATFAHLADTISQALDSCGEYRAGAEPYPAASSS